MSLSGNVPKIGNTDHEYRKQINKVLTRYEKKKARKQKEQKRREIEGQSFGRTVLHESASESEVSLHSGTSESEYFDSEEEKQKREKEKLNEKEETKEQKTTKIKGNDKLILEITPNQLIGATVGTASRFSAGSREHTQWLADFYRAAGVDINQISISKSKVHRDRTKLVQIEAQQIRDEEKDRMANLNLVLHFDTKKCEQVEADLHINIIHERLALSVSSPDAPKLDILLGIFEIESSAGETQAQAIWEVLCGWGITDQIIGLCADTTASNSGKYKGACINLSKMMDVSLLQLYCRHHIWEIHLSHILVDILGRTKGPRRDEYKLLKNNWPTLERDINDGDQSRLIKFDWRTTPGVSPGSFLERKAVESLQFCKRAKVANVFPRGDYKYLNDLVAFFLGDETQNFHFRQPGAHHEARFLADCNYLLVIYMTQNIIGNYDKMQSLATEDKRRQLKVACTYIACFHAKMFLQSTMAAKAPISDLEALKLSMNFAKIEDYKKIAGELHKSIRRHSYYLNSQLIGLSLADTDATPQERLEFLSVMLNFEVPHKGAFYRTKPELPDSAIFHTETDHKDLVDEQSYLLFIKLGFPKDVLESWRQGGAETFNIGSETMAGKSYQEFVEKVKNLQVVNDMAERYIKMIQDYIGSSRTEDQRQDFLQVIKRKRTVHPVDATKSVLAKNI